MRILHHWQAISVGIIALIFVLFPLQSFVPFRSSKDIVGTETSHEMEFAEIVNLQQLPTPEPTPTLTPLRVLVAGDLMFDRHIRLHAEQKGNSYIFAEITEFLRSADYVVVNLEGPITGFKSKSLGSVVGSPNNYLFTFPESVAKTLADNKITLVSLGNNHIFNFGQVGLEQTLTHLKEQSIQYFGRVSQTDSLVPLANLQTVKNRTVAWINFNQFSSQSKQSVLDEIKRRRTEAEYVIVYAHWDNEYQPKPSAGTVALAHAMIDAGADMVIGSHPHVIQISEVYADKKIYYSLGNFVFDQYFEPAVKKGMVLELTFAGPSEPIHVQEHLVELLPNGQTRLIKN